MLRVSIVGFAIAAIVFAYGVTAIAETPKVQPDNPKNHFSWWQANYDELSPQEDERAQWAHTIFARVLYAAGSRPGVVPRLYITKQDPFGVSFAIALPDGGIVLSKGVLDICYDDPQRGDHRLAFVLAHEIAHQLKADFWHFYFFQALEASASATPTQTDVLQEIRAIARRTNDVLAKELEADAWGIVYASMAGYNTRTIVSDDDQVNFFTKWVQGTDPHRITGAATDRDHPNPQQRAATVRVKLQEVLDKVDLFKLGFWFYQAEMYPQAVQAFEQFVRDYPSREVYHNLATSYHQLALPYYRVWKKHDLTLPFRLSLVIDPVTQASTILTRGSEKPEELFRQHINKAIYFYNEAIKLDPTYALSYNNLGCALILIEDTFRAIATLQDALKQNPAFLEAQNNLGVAFWHAKLTEEAWQHLTEAHQRHPKAAAPLFNLGKLAHASGRMDEARHYWTAYLQQDPASPWAEAIRITLALPQPATLVATPATNAAETLLGLEVRMPLKDIPSTWGTPLRTKTIPLERESYTVTVYPNGVAVVSRNKEIILLVTLEEYSHPTARGIVRGSTATDVSAVYGHPTQTFDTTQGVSWVYKTQGIVFQLRDARVVSWLVF